MGRRYGRRRPWALRGITPELPRGALVRVEGGNGGGRSTLLRLVVTGSPARSAVSALVTAGRSGTVPLPLTALAGALLLAAAAGTAAGLAAARRR
ncbi:hypothetical protein ACH4TC_16570 [Streptomyces spororaveus]|uniref:hypothetical protein n=1 Tax=Streptomyces spororaveus TaxID=284039 RepID=UPI003799B93A